MNDLNIIKQLGINATFRLLKLDKITFKSRGYTLDENGNVNGVSLYDITKSNGFGINLDSNEFAVMAKLLKKLPQLTTLYLASNSIKDITPLSDFKSLIEIILTNNQIIDISPLSGLINLIRLDLSNNQIKNITPLKNLNDLTELSLWNNQVNDISSLKDLTMLSKLNLRNNLIEDLPAWITSLGLSVQWKEKKKNKGFITLFNNPIKNPSIEIVMRGNEAISNYFKQSVDDIDLLYEAKLLIVGQGNVGKTWLMNRIIEGDIPNNNYTTEGIVIKTWNVETNVKKDFRVNVWDFGGQEIYHSTHQFFLTRRSLYLFVWEPRATSDILTFDYWLNAIKLLSENAPVLVVMNKYDERSQAIEEHSYMAAFPNIKGFCRVSAKEGTNIEGLIEEIKNEIERLNLVGNKLPKAWVNIREELESMEISSLSNTEYKGICKKHGLNSKQAEYLSEYYHDLGIFLHFTDNPVLDDIVFLKPEWATNAVYKIIDDKEVRVNNGRFTYKQLQEIWSVYDENKFHYLIELMKKFELCFQLGTSHNYIIPELLQVECTNLEWDFTNNLRFEYHYEFMPAGIVTRLTVRHHSKIKNNIFWKHGVIIEYLSTEALIVSETLNKRIRIWVKGKDVSELLYLIKQSIDDIHETLNNPKVKEKIPCNCKYCIKSGTPAYFDYLKLTLRKKPIVECPKHDEEEIYVDSLLRGFKKDSKNKITQKEIELYKD